MEQNWKDSREVPGTTRISYSQQQRKHIVRRNRRHLLPGKDKFHIQNDQDDYTEPISSTPHQTNPKTT